MRKIKQFISVFLCAALCLSVFAVSAQAKTKTPKKYVKSISIAKKATVTIPVNKSKITKSFKVTVKVKGKVSKKFTVKSSKTSVATAKVSGSMVKVTAKKAGKAKITVTTKAKGKSNKKLSKTLTLTVKKAQEPACLDEVYYDTVLKLSDKVDSTKSSIAYEMIENIVLNKKTSGAYYAKVADTSVVNLTSNSTKMYAVSEGSTTADIYEELNNKTRKLGTINLTVEKATMSEVWDDLFLQSDDTSDLISQWLKLNFAKTQFNVAAVINKILINNDELGTKFTADDFSLTYNTTNDKVATVSAEGVITGVKNGVCGVDYTIDFKDGSIGEGQTEVTVTGNAIEKVAGYSMETVRDNIVGVNTLIELENGTKQPLINFDNAATTPAFKAVQQAVDEELEMYGSIGRGYSQKSNHSTDVYNSTRDKVLEFFTADPEQYTCFYTNSTTDGLNKLASALITSKKDIVLTTRIEHHANDLSWRERCKVIYAEVDEQGRVIYDDIEKLLKKNKVKIVSITAASNVTGYVSDVHRVAKLAHKYGAMLVVDGAQIVAHRKVEMMGDLNDPDDDIDFIAFSAHKMYSPYGGGAVVGLTSELNEHMPTFYGGGTIKVVGDDWQVYKEAPAAYEAGSPNYPGVVGLGKAIDVLSTIGMDKIQAHEKVLNRKVIDALKTQPNVILYGDSENIDDRVGVVTFNFHDINTLLLAEQLSQLGGVATRRGAFCAHPYVWRLMGISDETARGFENCVDGNTAGMVRLSFGIYNNEDEIDQFLAVLPSAMAKAKELNPNGQMNPEY